MTPASASPASFTIARNATPGIVLTCVDPAHEAIIRASKGKVARHAFNYDLVDRPSSGSQVSSVWRIPAVPGREKALGYHPTQKPLRLVRRAFASTFPLPPGPRSRC